MAIFAIVALSFGTAVTSRARTNTVKNTPIDVWGFAMHTASTNETVDSFLTTDCHIYGPYDLCSASGYPMAKSLNVIGGFVGGTSPQMRVEYQLIPSTNIKDTAAGQWVIPNGDTVSDAIPMNLNVDLSTKAGRSIVLRVNNFDNATGWILGNMYAYFKSNIVFQRDK